jgi:2-oxo-4-hydroxy-4-carboxy-5-ureidoimidazoline decarboxylase
MPTIPSPIAASPQSRLPMPATTLSTVTLSQLNILPASAFVALTGGVFEHSSWVAEKTAESRPFASVAALHRTMVEIVAASSEARKLALIRAHPDLAGRLAQQGQLTAESTREQASAGLAQADAATVERIQALNTLYRARFDFPFIICARLHKVEAIIAAMERRLTNEPATEVKAALTEIYKIAQLRLNDIVAS